MTESYLPKPEILVIDDDESICETLEVIIQSLGYYCVFFTNPEQGLEYFKREVSPLILLDVNLPNFNGIDLLSQIKEINPMSQVLMMTGEREIQTVVSSLYNRATDFLLKPFNLESVKSAIARAFEFYYILKEKEINDESILRDLRLASKIQSKILSMPKNLSHRMFAEVNPAMYVSGDYFQILNIDENKTLVVMGDIEDHGVTSGLIALLMSNLVKEISNTNETSPAVYLQKMNYELCFEIGTHSMTAVIILIDREKKQIIYSRGGHPFPIFYKADRSEYQLLSERSGHLLGIMEDIEFHTHQIGYEKGDLLFLYSDGLINTLQSPLLDSMNNIHLNSKNRFEQMLDILKDYTIELRENSHFQDDISYLLIEL
ncbi:fused response regulator/phosphatase [Leptospira sp. GIMC2001]|uniref:fused response regulator/phosphatase n=1 Tax=Leptospira sp. GIMC2001 TaxID=1513297 RepID=UPI00234A79CA|nr:fused response regulator/phosphatase [Leptospira sp. GIMC2001]WCL48239.1 fused response regulator/phosphatase [Leptospira sp. GIMC2001]